MFRTRLLSGIVLVAIALGVFLTGGALLAVVIFGVSVIAYQELTAACKVRGEKPEPSAPVIVGLVMTLVYYALIGLALARDVTFAFPVMMMVIMAAFLAFFVCLCVYFSEISCEPDYVRRVLFSLRSGDAVLPLSAAGRV